MSASPHIPFALPDIGEEEIAAVVAALRSGWLSSGPRVQQFEAAVAAVLGSGVYAVAVNSATAGLHLALEASGIGPGDDVLVPTWTFTATAEVVSYLGANPVFVDADPVTLNIDLDDARTRLTARTRAIIPVHFAGLPLDPEALMRFAAEHRLKVIEDAAHAFPAARGGRQVGAGTSAATVLSFYATKTLTTGEGGMILTRDADLASRCRTMRLHGISRDVFDRYRSNSPSWQYEVIAPGYKYNMTDPAAAMGIVQLSRANMMRQRRAAIAETYFAKLADTRLVLPAIGPSDVVHSWHLFVIQLPPHIERERFIQHLSTQGVGTSVHFIPLHLHPYWSQRYALRAEDFPSASTLFEDVVSLPIYSAMSDFDVDVVCTAVVRALAS